MRDVHGVRVAETFALRLGENILPEPDPSLRLPVF